MAEIKTLLDDVIEKELENLNNISDREERSKALRDIAQLDKLRIDEGRMQIEADDKEATRLSESEKSKHQKRDNWIDRGLKIGHFMLDGVMTVASVVSILLCFRFEETGTISGFASKNQLGNLFRIKR